ncbi:hypothetical protein ACIQU6_41685 [Streptomyces sp. NPDC090442]|uniref:hypothetical protein n=1 Tax=Streptomyces sp. NPDC090442 TaxID=3365962 RepID=UPI003814408C
MTDEPDAGGVDPPPPAAEPAADAPPEPEAPDVPLTEPAAGAGAEPSPAGAAVGDDLSAPALDPAHPEPLTRSDATQSTELGDEADTPWWARPAEAAQDAWAEHGPEAQAALRDIGTQMGQAAEIGAQIGDAIADRLDPNAAAQKRGLDISWLHLKLNIPALVIAIVAWVWGVGPAAVVVQVVRTQGALAPLGWVLLVAALLGLFALVPIGSALASAVGHLVMALVGGVRSALTRGWRMRYVGYALRLVVVTLAWVAAIGFLRVAWRMTLHWLTGV